MTDLIMYIFVNQVMVEWGELLPEDRHQEVTVEWEVHRREAQHQEVSHSSAGHD